MLWLDDIGLFCIHAKMHKDYIQTYNSVLLGLVRKLQFCCNPVFAQYASSQL